MLNLVLENALSIRALPNPDLSLYSELHRSSGCRSGQNVVGLVSFTKQGSIYCVCTLHINFCILRARSAFASLFSIIFQTLSFPSCMQALWKYSPFWRYANIILQCSIRILLSPCSVYMYTSVKAWIVNLTKACDSCKSQFSLTSCA